MNGVNLEHFQFEYDLTWMSFFQDEKGRTYTRYGGRDDSGSESHLNKESLLTTMHAVLELHKTKSVQPFSRFEPFPEPDSEVPLIETPSELPTMKQMMSKRKESCIHCHDVKVARLRHHHEKDTLQKDMVFTYPSPQNLGFMIDPKQQNIIQEVAVSSPAAKGGLRSGDKLLFADGHRVLTYADLTRVLEVREETGKLQLVIERDKVPTTHELKLPKGWRISNDPAWRSSLHVVGPGAGFWGRPANKKERKPLKLGPTDLALKVTFIWADHAKASKVKVGDIITDLDGHRENMNMRQFHAFLNLNRKWGDKIKLTGVRKGNPIELKMALPSEPPWE